MACVRDGTACIPARSFVVNGEPASKDAALSRLGADKIPDDSNRPRLVVVGTTAARKKVLDDWSSTPQLQAFKDKVILQSYSPDHEHVRGIYEAFSDVSIYLMASDGKLITWQPDYDGPERLAKGLEAGLRKADPSFNPKKTPDLSKPLASNDVILVGLCCLGAARIAVVNKKVNQRKMTSDANGFCLVTRHALLNFRGFRTMDTSAPLTLGHMLLIVGVGLFGSLIKSREQPLWRLELWQLRQPRLRRRPFRA